MEHRWGARHTLERMVSLRAGAWHVLAQIENISSSGAYLRCAAPVAGVVRMRVDFRQDPSGTRLVGRVVRHTTDGIGIEWSEFAPRAITRLLSGAHPGPATSAAPSETSRVA